MVRRRSTAGFRNGAAGGTLVDGVGTFGSVPNAGWRVRAVPPAAFIPSLVVPALLGRMHGAVRVSGQARSTTFGARAGPAGLAGPKTWAASRLAAGPGLVVMPPGPCGRPARTGRGSARRPGPGQSGCEAFGRG